MVVDLLRSCYKTVVRWTDEEDGPTSTIRWYFVPWGTRRLPYETTFDSRNYFYSEPWQWPNVGEVLGALRPWNNGAAPAPAPPGIWPSGPPEAWAGEATSPITPAEACPMTLPISYGLVRVTVLAGAGDYTWPEGIDAVYYRMVGGGGGGGGLPATLAGQLAVSGGGAGGTYSEGLYLRDPAPTAYVVGAGGAAGGAGAPGGVGGTTSFGLKTAPGGPGGGALAVVIPPAVGQVASGLQPAAGVADYSSPGQAGTPGWVDGSAIGFGAAAGSGVQGGGGSSLLGCGHPGTSVGGAVTPLSAGGGASGRVRRGAAAVAQVGIVGRAGTIILWELSTRRS